MLRSLFAATFLIAGLGCIVASPAQAQNTTRTASRPAPFASLGALAGQMTAGQSGAWLVRDDAGQLSLANPAAAGAIRYYTTDWQGDLVEGRSVSVRVTAKASAGLAAGGLSQAGVLFRLTNEDPRWMAYGLDAEGKLGLYVRRSNELKRIGTYDLPGGHRPEGDVLALNQKDETTQLLANGYLVGELKPVNGVNPNAPAPVGVVTMGIGEFTLGNFSFGKPIVPTPPPSVAGNDDTVPVPSGGDDTVPVPVPVPVATPAPAAATPPRPPAAQHSEVPTLGPLGHDVTLGNNQNWEIAIEAGALVFTHSAEDDLYYYNRSIAWTGAAEGGSATVNVESRGTSKDSGGGLLFGLTADGKAFWALEAAGDGKIKLFHLKDGEFILSDAFDPPLGQIGMRRHQLKMSQNGRGMTLYVDGKLLTVVPPNEPAGFDPAGRVGISMRGNGRFAFQDYAFGAPDQPPPRPAAPFFATPSPAAPSPAAPSPAAPSPATPSPAAPAPAPAPVIAAPVLPRLGAPVIAVPPASTAPSPDPGSPAASGDLEQILIGRWRETMTGSGPDVIMLLDLRPQSAYQAQLQVAGPQPVTIDVEGVWTVVPAGGNRAQLSFVPQRWTPPEAAIEPISVTIELVGRNSFRSADGSATRIQ